LRSLRRALEIAALAVAALGTGACGSCRSPSAAVEAGAPAAMTSPVPAPDGLLAEAWVRGPDAAWGKIQRGVSGPVALLPSTVGELVCAFTGLDGPLGQLVDGKGTSYVVIGAGAGDGASPGWVVALALNDGARAAALLLEVGDASAAKGSSGTRDVAGMQVLTAPSLRATVALATGAHPWLVLASSDDDLAHLGPYAVRTMPTKETPSDTAAVVADMAQPALAGALSSWLAAKWNETRTSLAASDDDQRAKHGGRAPDFADPGPLVEALDGAVKRRIGLVAQARAARVTVDPGDDELHAELTVAPGTDAASRRALAEMLPGDTRPLAATSGEAVAALMVREDPKAREDDAATFQATLDRAMGDRLHESDARAVHAAIADWAHARGDWWTAALAWGAGGDALRGAWLRTPAASAEDSSRAVRGILDLSHRPVFQDLVANWLHLAPAVFSHVDAPPLGSVSLATFARAPGHSANANDASGPIGVAWNVSSGGGGTEGEPSKESKSELLVAAGETAPRLLSAQVAPQSQGRLGDDPRSVRALAALGENATFVVFAQPLRLEHARGDASGDRSAPVVLGWGRKGPAAWVRIEVADAVLREALSWFARL
jgi:hypothetical protein